MDYDGGVEETADNAELLAVLAALHIDEELAAGAHAAQILQSAAPAVRREVAALVVYGSDAALQVLSRDGSEQVRAGVAGNQDVYFGPDSTLLALAGDTPAVAVALARNPLIAGDEVIQLPLAQHPCPEVRLAVLGNGPGPLVVELLLHDVDPRVRAAAQERAAEGRADDDGPHAGRT